MSAGTVAFLLGLYVVPLVLLAGGQHLRRRPPRARRAFWGAIIGHLAAATLALIAGLSLPESWTANDSARGFLGLWALLLFPIVGALLGAVTARPGNEP